MHAIGGTLMSSLQNRQFLDDARRFAENLAAEARSDVSAKIFKVDEACRAILESGGTVSMRSVRAWLSTNMGLTIASQTLMNRRLDRRTGSKVHSPLRQVIEKYAKIQNLAFSSPKMDIKVASSGAVAISEAELALIPDHLVRYKAQLLVGRVRNLENQLNQLRTIANLPSLSEAILSEGTLASGTARPNAISEGTGQILNEGEIDALADFLKPSSCRRRGLSFDNLGGLKVTHPASRERKVASLSTPDLQSALEKILKFCQG